MQPLVNHARSHDLTAVDGLGQERSYRLLPSAKRALRYLMDVVQDLPARSYDLGDDPRPPVLIWSDAMWADGEGKGGFVVYFPKEGEKAGRLFFSEHVPGKDVVKAFVKGKKTYIGQLELLYAVAPYTTMPRRLAGRRVLHFIDNTSAIAALVKGYSSAVDSGLIVNAFHAYNVGLVAEPYFEYVRSAANVSDLPSRGKIMSVSDVFFDPTFMPIRLKASASAVVAFRTAGRPVDKLMLVSMVLRSDL